MSVKVEVRLDDFKRTMKEKQDKMKILLPKGVANATLYLHGKIKNSIARGTNADVAVDTGRFLNSVDFDSPKDTQGRVFTDLEYAKFIEYGTSKMAARPHFRNTAAVEKEKIKEEMSNEVKLL